MRAIILARTGLVACALATSIVALADAVTVLESDRQNLAFFTISEPDDSAFDNDQHRTVDSEETFGPQAQVIGTGEAGSYAIGNAAQTSYFLDDSFTLIGSFFSNATVEDEVSFAEGFGQSRLEVVFEVDVPTVLTLQGAMNSAGLGGGTVIVRTHDGEIHHNEAISGDQTLGIDVELALVPGVPYAILMHVGGYAQAGTPHGGVAPSHGDYYAIAQFSTAVGVAGTGWGPSAVTVGPNPLRAGRPLSIATGTVDAVDVVVHDASGREVRRLATAGGRRSLDWDGRDRTGREVAPGVYFVRVVGDALDATRRVTVLR